MGFDQGGVLLEAVVEFPQCSVGVRRKPSRFSQQELSISKSTILFGHVFQQLYGLDQVLGRLGIRWDRFRP